MRCSKCNKEIKNPTYFIRDLGYLCGQHAREHGLMKMAEIDLEISGLRKEQQEINKESTIAFQNDCEHKWIDTGYGVLHEDKLKNVCRCVKCGLTENKEDGQI